MKAEFFTSSFINFENNIYSKSEVKDNYRLIKIIKFGVIIPFTTLVLVVVFID